MHVEKLSWKQWLLNGQYGYLVTNIRQNKKTGAKGHAVVFDVENRLMQVPLPSLENSHRSNLKPEVAKWLIDCLPYSDWAEQRPEDRSHDYVADGRPVSHVGIYFRKKKHITMFKLAFG